MDDRRPVNDCFALPPGVDWTPVEAALDALRASLAPVTEAEPVPLSAALGRILTAPATARVSHPAAANAAVDGYAFAHADYLAAPMIIAPGRAAAGAPSAEKLGPGAALRVLTGGVIPEGADTVMLDEDARVEGGRLHGPTGLKKGANLRRAGENISAGDAILTPGTRLTPQALAHATLAGLGEVTARRRLRVAILSTGDEIAAPGAALPPGGVHDANGPMLAALARAWGHDVVEIGVARDDEDAVRAALTQAAAADAILASGGASAGDEDHMARLLGAEGTRAVWRIAMKPGRPLALGRWRGAPVFGLPGNPVAAFVCALIFARPALSLMAGAGWRAPRAETRPAAFSKRRKAGRDEFLRARLTEDGAVEPFANEGSGLTKGLVWAEGLAHLPDGGPDIAPGDLVRYLPYASFGL